ncbi:MAG: ABC transporter ATP-binding protein [Aquabacterium sp.]
MSHIVFESVRQVYANGVLAVDTTSFSVGRGEFVCLVGPSGCGKSTLLNMAAGFQRPSSGAVLVDGEPVLAPHPDRAMVFQEYGLFPWMTVFRNIAFGLENAGRPASQIKARVQQLLGMCGLSDFADAYPKDLSGGMKQRVALARALALKPPILLMDEPFAALDALTRRTLQDELLKLWRESNTTVLFVTHSIEEALHLADRVIVLTSRPGTIKCDIGIDLPRPREASNPTRFHLHQMLDKTVMAEQDRHMQAQAHKPSNRGSS